MGSRRRLVGLVTLCVVAVVGAIAFALGGGSAESGSRSTPASSGAGRPSVDQAPARSTEVGAAATRGSAAVTSGAASVPSAPSRASAGQSVEDDVVPAAAVTATRVVKQGSLDVSVPRGQVTATMTKLIGLATSMGGYVQSSQSNDAAGYPTGSLTLRVPTARFEQTVVDAERLGTVTSLTTSAQDVTGRYVDLSARSAALQRARSTYLTILSRATTIAAILSVQQRVDDIQQQIEQLQGQLKVLRNQSSDATLDVSVAQRGTPVMPRRRAHRSGGIGAAWHRSMQRFARGFDAIVAALGPLLLALLIVAAAVLVGRLGYWGLRRTTS